MNKPRSIQFLQTKRGKKYLYFFLKILISVLVLSILIHKISLTDILVALESARKGFILFALLLLPANVFFQFKKWQLLLKIEKPQASQGEVIFSLLAGITLGFVTPGRLGEFGRAIFVRHAHWPRLLGFIAIEKLFALLMIYFFGFLGLIYFLKTKMEYFHLVLLTSLFLVIFAIILFLLLNPKILDNLLGRMHFYSGRSEKIKQFTSAFQAFSSFKAHRLLGFCLAQTLIYILQFSLLVNAFSSIAITKAFLAVGATMMVKSMLPIAIGDLGVRESAAVFFFNMLHVPGAAAFDASLLLFFINLLIPSIIGLILILKNRYISNTGNSNSEA